VLRVVLTYADINPPNLTSEGDIDSDSGEIIPYRCVRLMIPFSKLKAVCSFSWKVKHSIKFLMEVAQDVDDMLLKTTKQTKIMDFFH